MEYGAADVEEEDIDDYVARLIKEQRRELEVPLHCSPLQLPLSRSHYIPRRPSASRRPAVEPGLPRRRRRLTTHPIRRSGARAGELQPLQALQPAL